MKLQLIRTETNDKRTFSDFIINGIFRCYTLEDPIRKKKLYGKTAIPAGTYEIKLRKAGRMHKKYSQKFPEMHKGMIHITGINKNPLLSFKYVYIHIGNTPEDTLGCPLTGTQKGKNRILNSTKAYKQIYPSIAEALEKGERVFIEITNQIKR